MGNIQINLNKPVNRIIKESGINYDTALYAAGEAMRLMDCYVPMNTGALANTARIFADNGKGVVLYIQPYARFCYYGEKKVFNRDKHEKASAFWDRAMTSANRGVLTRSVGNYIKKKK